MNRLLPILLTSCNLKVKNLSKRKKTKYIYVIVDKCFNLVKDNYFDFFTNESNFIDLIILKSSVDTGEKFKDCNIKDNKLIVTCLNGVTNSVLLDRVEFIQYVEQYEMDTFKSIYEATMIFKSKDNDYTITLDLNNVRNEDSQYDEDIRYIDNNKCILNEIGECLFKEYMKQFILYYINLYDIDIIIYEILRVKYDLNSRMNGGYICL